MGVYCSIFFSPRFGRFERNLKLLILAEKSAVKRESAKILSVLWCLSKPVRLSIFKLRGGAMIFLLECLDMAINVFKTIIF